MNETEIRRLHITDENWNRTSNSYKKLKPLRNFNYLQDSDESPFGCYKRLKAEFDIPFEVIEQWIYQHYYESNSVKNYGWIDYQRNIFKKVVLNVSEIINLSVIEEYQSFVYNRSRIKSLDNFTCMSEDKVFWGDFQTWRTPPVVLDVTSYDNIPDYCDIKGKLQLIEGHSRLGYFLALHKMKYLTKNEHEVYLLSKRNTLG